MVLHVCNKSGCSANLALQLYLLSFISIGADCGAERTAQAACVMARQGKCAADSGPPALVQAGRGMSEATVQSIVKASTKALGAWGCLEGTEKA